LRYVVRGGFPRMDILPVSSAKGSPNTQTNNY
jgi:hypothetical protein